MAPEAATVRGGGAGGLSSLMNCSEQKALITPIPHNLAGPGKIYIVKLTAVIPQVKKIFMRGVIGKVQY
jgi:hypothetical protein